MSVRAAGSSVVNRGGSSGKSHAAHHLVEAEQQPLVVGVVVQEPQLDEPLDDGRQLRRIDAGHLADVRRPPSAGSTVARAS